MNAETNQSHQAHAHAHVGSAAANIAGVADGARYTCPMHAEIVQDAPGSCPKCGMALVPVAGTGEADDSELRDLTRRLRHGNLDHGAFA